jgi:hypothetical protein
MDTITAREVLALPSEALPGVHTDAAEDSAGDCWRALRLLAAGEIWEGRVMGSVLYATSSRWSGRRRIVAA